MLSVVVQRHEAVLQIMLNRPEVLDAANRELIAGLAAAAAEAAEDRSARVVLLRGAGTISAPAATSRCSASWSGCQPPSAAGHSTGSSTGFTRC